MSYPHEMLRSLVRSPGFTLSVVLTLGLAIGANSALFTLVDQVIFRSLPVAEPSELVVINAPFLPVGGPFMTVSKSEARGEGGEVVKVWGLSYPLFVRLAKRVPEFQETMAFFGVRGNMPANDRTLEVHATLVTGNYFRTLGIHPFLGRFPDADASPDDRAVAVLSYGFWQRQFGGDTGIINRTIRLESAAVTVVGVAPSGFTGTVSGMRVDLFVPLQMADVFENPKTLGLGPLVGVNTGWDSPFFNRLTAVARLAAGVSRRDAEKAADVVYHQLQAESIAALRRPLSDQSKRRMASDHLTLLPAGMAGSQQVGTVQALDTVLSLLMGMVALILLVAAGNVANLQVARGSSRMRETAIRLALGATRGRLLRGCLVETLALAFLAGAVGLLLSSWLTRLVPAVLGLTEMPPGVSETPDWRVVIFTVAVSAATGLLIWSISAIQVIRRADLPTLSGSSVLPARAGALVVRRTLLLVQVALSATLLCGAALLTRSLVGLMLVNPGFDVSGLAAFTVTPGSAAYDDARAWAVVESLVARTRALPGIDAVSASSHLPLSGGTSRYWLLGDDPATDRAAPVLVDTVRIGDHYFETVGLPLVAGRGFTPADRVDTPKVAVLSESLARQLFGGRPAVGRRVTFSRADGTDTAVRFANRDAVFDIEIVGVARDARSHSLRAGPPPTIYSPLLQQAPAWPLAIMLRTTRAMPDPLAVQALVSQVDPKLAVSGYETIRRTIAAGLARERLLAALSSAFGVLAAVLSAMGVLGLTGFVATRRAHEIGVRLALGCSRGRATRLIMREVTWLAAAGTFAGGALYAGASRYLRSALYELSPTDAVTIIGAVALLMLVAHAAAYFPARRAARIDPAVTLRAE